MIINIKNPARAIDRNTFADITDATVIRDPWWTDWGAVAIEFSRDLTDQERMLVKIRAWSADEAEEIILRQAFIQLQNNLDYLNLSPPSDFQVRQQVAALTRQVNALIRRLIRE